MQWFKKTYRAMPTFTQHAGYGEVRRVLHPRWYAAARLGYAASSVQAAEKAWETVIGYRPNAWQLVKVGYQVSQGPKFRGSLGNTFAIQVVTTLRPISLTRD
jgi:hypothetical protein